MAEGWCLHPGLVLRWEGGRLLAATPSRSEPFPIEAELVPLLEPFAVGHDVEAGVGSFLERFAGNEAQADIADHVWATVRQFQGAGLLVPADGPQPPVRNSYETAAPHVLMLADHGRTASYREVLARHAPRRTGLEIGCGSGILSCFAVRAGARHVYAIEQTSIIELARDIAERNGVADRITFIQGTSLSVDLPEQVDFVVSELMGTDLFAEGGQPALVDARRRFLKPSGCMIPLDLSIWTVGVESRSFSEAGYAFEQKRRTAARLGAAYGLDLTPLVEAYDSELRHKEASLAYQPMLGNFVDYETAQHGETILTAEQLVLEVRCGDELDTVTKVPLEAEATGDGIHNGMLTFFTSRLDEHSTITTSPFAPQPMKNWRQIATHLEPRPVRRGDTIELLATVDLQASPNTSYSRQS